MPPIIATLWASIKAAKMAITLAVIAVLVLLNIGQAVNTYANLRWDGPFGIVIGFEGWKPKAERRDREHKAFVNDVEAAQITARANQQAAMDREKARYDELAERTDREYQASQVEAMSAADRYIAANRVRPPSGSVASDTSAATQGDGAASDIGPRSPPIVDAVAVSADDVRICTVNTSRLIAAHLWAVGLAEDE